MYRVEVVEITSYAGDIERISSPAKTEQDIKELLDYYMKEYKEEIEREEYYLKVAYYKVEDYEV